MSTTKQMDPVEEFIEAAVRHIGAHHCLGGIEDPATHAIKFVRGAEVFGGYQTELVLPTLAHLKHGPTRVEEAVRLAELEKLFRSKEYKPAVAAYAKGENSLPKIAGASRQYFDEILAPVMTAAQSPVTGVAETALWPVSPFTSTSANQLQPGQEFRVSAGGILTSAASSPGTLTITPRYGTTSGGTALGASAASATLTTSQTNVVWKMLINGIVRSVGSSASMFIDGEFTCSAVLASPLNFGGTIATVDTTTAQGIYIGVTLGSASDSMTVERVAFELLN